MSEQFISHAEVDRAIFPSEKDRLAESGMQRALAKQEWEASREELRTRNNEELLGRGAMASFMAEERQRRHEEAVKSSKEAEDERLFAANARRYGMGYKVTRPTDAFVEQKERYKLERRDIEEAGRSTESLNEALAEKVQNDETESGFDVSRLTPREINEYKDSLNVLLGESPEQYSQRMTEVFGTEDYIRAIEEIMDNNQQYALRQVAKRNPGANPLADQLLSRWEAKQSQELENS